MAEFNFNLLQEMIGWLLMQQQIKVDLWPLEPQLPPAQPPATHKIASTFCSPSNEATSAVTCTEWQVMTHTFSWSHRWHASAHTAAGNAAFKSTNRIRVFVETLSSLQVMHESKTHTLLPNNINLYLKYAWWYMLLDLNKVSWTGQVKTNQHVRHHPASGQNWSVHEL